MYWPGVDTAFKRVTATINHSFGLLLGCGFFECLFGFVCLFLYASLI